MIRYRMNKLLRFLEKNDLESFNSAILSAPYKKALRALEDQKCVKVQRAWGGDIIRIDLKNHYVTYQLSRREAWLNRLFGFLAGVLTSVVAAIIIGLLLV